MAFRTWDGGGDGTTWADAANWDNDTSVTAGDFLYFSNPTGNLVNNLAADTQFDGIFIQNTGGNPTFSGNSVQTINGVFVDDSFGLFIPITTEIQFAIGGSGPLSKTGYGTLILNAANTFSGEVSVSQGVIALAASGSLNAATTLSLTTNGTLDLGFNHANQTFAAVTMVQGNIVGTGTSRVTSASAFDMRSGTASVSLGGSGGLIKSTAGTVTLSGNNVYSGTTAVNEGVLSLAGGLAISNSSDISIIALATLELQANEVIGSLSGASGSFVSLGANTLTVNSSASSTFAGQMSGSGSLGLVKTGTGTLTLSGSNTFTGDTRINNGTLTYGASDVLVGSIHVNNVNAVLNIGAFDDTVASVLLSNGTIEGTTGILASDDEIVAQNGTISAILGGSAGFRKASVAGVVTLLGSNVYTGTTTVANGTLALGASGSINSASSLVLNNANCAFDLGSNHAPQSFCNVLMISGSIYGTGTSTLFSATQYDFRAGTVTAILDGSSGLLKQSAGALTLAGANTFTGQTNVTGGILTVAAGGSFNANSSVRVAGSTTVLDLGANHSVQGFSSVQLALDGTIAGSGTTEITSAADFDIQSGSVSVILGGASGLQKTTGGTAVLFHANSYAGTTVVAAGTLTLNTTSSVNPNSAMVVSGGNFNLGDNHVVQGFSSVSLVSGSIAGTGTSRITSQSDYDVQSGVINLILGGNSGLSKTGSGDVALFGSNTYTGNTVISAGKLVIRGFQPASNVRLDDGSLAGTGTIGDLVALGGSVEPGDGAGLLNVSGNLSLGGGATFLADILGTGTPGIDWDLLAVAGTVNLSGANLALNLGYQIGIGSMHMIIQKQSPGPVVGGFQSIPAAWAVNYFNGDSNDVALIYMGPNNAPPSSSPGIPTQIVYPGQNPTAGGNANSSNDSAETSDSSTTRNGLFGLPIVSSNSILSHDLTGLLSLNLNPANDTGRQSSDEQDVSNRRFLTDNQLSRYHMLLQNVEELILAATKVKADEFARGLSRIQIAAARTITDNILTGFATTDTAKNVRNLLPELNQKQIERLVDQAKSLLAAKQRPEK